MDLSIRNEARAARDRAESWRRGRAASPEEPPLESAADVAAWLPLLAGGVAGLAIDAAANLAMGAMPFRWSFVSPTPPIPVPFPAASSG